MNIAIIGLSHKTAPVEVREKLSIPSEQIQRAIAHLQASSHIKEAAILSTCNRLEIYIVANGESMQASQAVTQFLSAHSQLPCCELEAHLFTLLKQDAIKHLMNVACGLDSLVMGEGQILAQVKHAYKVGQEYKGIKRTLNQLFRQAITVGKRVRTETSIGTGAVSISAAAVELAQTKVPDLAACKVAVIGAGKMARLLIKHLLAKGVTRLVIVNRSVERAQQLADEFSPAQLPCCSLEMMLDIVGSSDLVFTSTASTEPMLDKAKLASVLSPEQSLRLIDISVPRNVAADVSGLQPVQVFNVDDLKTVVAQNQESRQQAAQAAEALIEEELKAFVGWSRSQEAVPVINCLRAKVESIREQEVAKAMSRLGVDLAQRHQGAIESLTRGIVNKILHEPMVQLRANQNLEEQRLALQTLEKLFDLNSCVISFSTASKK